MTFVHAGLAAAGLAAVALPILVHLLMRRRRKPVRWAAMRFLAEAMRRQRRRLRLEQILLLLARCLLVACVGLAVARPLLDRAGALGGVGGRDVYLLIDNGLASQIRGPDGAVALDRHLDRAREVLDGLGPGDRAGLVTLGGPARVRVAPASADLAAVRRLLTEITPTESATDLPGAVGRLADVLSGEDEPPGAGGGAVGGAGRSVALAVLSEFRRGSADVARPLVGPGSALPGAALLAPVPASEPIGNVQVVGVEPVRSAALLAGEGSGRFEARVTLRRVGPAAADAGVTAARVRSLRVDRSGAVRAGPVAEGVLRWRPGQAEGSVTVAVEAPAADGADPGLGAGSRGGVLVAEIDRDALDADNTLIRRVRVGGELGVGLVGRRRFGERRDVADLTAAEWFRLALEPLGPGVGGLEVGELEPAGLAAPVLATLDALVLPDPDLIDPSAWDRLGSFVRSGGVLIVSPPADATVHLWADALIDELVLPWRVAREASAPGGAEGGDSGGAGVSAETRGGLLGLGREELEQLAAPVRVERVLRVEEASAPGSRAVLSLTDGTPLVVAASPDSAAGGAGAAGNVGTDDVDKVVDGAGLVVLLTAAPTLDWTDLPARPLMVPLVQELVRQGVARASASASAVAGRAGPDPGDAWLPVDIPGRPGRGGSDVDDSLAADGVARAAGLFRVRDVGGADAGLVPVNPDPEGGRSDAQDRSVIGPWLASAVADSAGAGDAAGAGTGVGREGDSTSAGERSAGAGGRAIGGGSGGGVVWLDEEGDAGRAVAEADRGSPVSLPLLIAAIGLALAELAMARWFSHATVDGPGRRGGRSADGGAAA